MSQLPLSRRPAGLLAAAGLRSEPAVWGTMERPKATDGDLDANRLRGFCWCAVASARREGPSAERTLVARPAGPADAAPRVLAVKEEERRDESRVLPHGDVGVEARVEAAVLECCAGRGEEVSVLFRKALWGCTSLCWAPAWGRAEAGEEAAEPERVRGAAGGVWSCGMVRPKAERGAAGAAKELPGRELVEMVERRDSVDRAEAETGGSGGNTGRAGIGRSGLGERASRKLATRTSLHSSASLSPRYF